MTELISRITFKKNFNMPRGFSRPIQQNFFDGSLKLKILCA